MPTLRLLVEAGAMVDATDNDGWTPLRYALEQRECSPAVIWSLLAPIQTWKTRREHSRNKRPFRFASQAT